ncbi:MAG: helix-hairpin-helix domain-containing protein [Burkholderiaceae bacterium]|nr:helix-hairpin-helix domain-containing protein [Burkholderiaceae bacterium]
MTVLLAGCSVALACWPQEAGALDVNRATASQLQSIKGIGPRTAANIVAERARGGAFESLGELAERVRGIGAKSVIRLRAAGLVVPRPALGNAQSDSRPMSRRPITPPAGLSSKP